MARSSDYEAALVASSRGLIDFLTHMPLGVRIIIAAIVAHIVVLAVMSNRGE
jgi:hypothetical protein